MLVKEGTEECILRRLSADTAGELALRRSFVSSGVSYDLEKLT
jgi:hypothetical protein